MAIEKNTAEARITAIEHTVGGIREQIASVSAQMRHQDNELTAIRKDIHALAASMQAKSSTDWKALASWGGLVISVVILYTSLVTSPLRESQIESRNDVADLSTRVTSMERQYLSDRKEELIATERQGRYIERIDRVFERVERLENLYDERTTR